MSTEQPLSVRDDNPMSSDLFQRFRVGEPTALSEVYRRYVGSIRRYLRRRFDVSQAGSTTKGVRDPNGECDLLQEVFIRAFSAKARTSFDRGRPYLPYLRTIAHNVSIDFYRRVSCRERLDEAIPEPATPPDAPETFVDDQRLKAKAWVYVSRLDAEAQEFVRLRYFEEISQEGVAVAMGCTRRRVRTLERDTIDGMRTWFGVPPAHQAGGTLDSAYRRRGP